MAVLGDVGGEAGSQLAAAQELLKRTNFSAAPLSALLPLCVHS